MFGQRIAQKIWLGYAIPLAVLVVAGVLVPAALSGILGLITRQYERYDTLLNQVQAMQRAALDSHANLRFYRITGEDEYRRQYIDSRETYRDLRRNSIPLAAGHDALSRDLIDVETAYRAWMRRVPMPQTAAPRPNLPGMDRGQREFEAVRAAFERLLLRAKTVRDTQAARAASAERVQLTMALAGPAVALALALLIGRSISLGVTRPLEDLTRATEALEKGHAAALLAENDTPPDDEIGDLKRAFSQMVRTIGHREAVLRTQNDALGALNRRIEAVLNATNDGIVMLDRGGGFSVVNQRFADLFGLDADALLDHTFDQVGPLLLARFKDTRTVRRRMRELLPDPDVVADETHDIVEPERRVLRIYSAPVHGESGDRLGRIFVFRDVTRETMVDRMKTEFVSVVSHELRTPLTAIKGYVDLIVSGQTGPVTEIQREFLTIVQSSTSRLTALINDMLDISRIESGRVEVKHEVVNYARVVRETVATLAQEAEAKNITLSVEAPDDLPPVSGDADRIAQVLVNLISNGIKYTPGAGRVTVTIQPEETLVITCIADTGIGIGPEDQQKLFQKFFRADNSTTRETGGTGLGLAITKAILEKLNGSIWVESEPDQGSRFFFTLPIAEKPPVSSEGAPARGHGVVLSVDDDPAILRLLSHQLTRHGFATVSASSGDEALRRARELMPDAITLDLMMPGMDGFTVLRHLKADDATRQIPVILVSVLAGDHKGQIHDAFDFLKKPIDEEHLVETIRKAVAGRKERPTILVMGEAAIADCLRGRFGEDTLRVVAAQTEAEAQARAAELVPDLVVLDADTPGEDAMRLVASLHRQPATARVPFVVLTENAICGEGVHHLVPLGAGPLALEHLAAEVGKLLSEKEPMLPAPPSAVQ